MNKKVLVVLASVVVVLLAWLLISLAMRKTPAPVAPAQPTTRVSPNAPRVVTNPVQRVKATVRIIDTPTPITAKVQIVP